jgi:hypothetical protein
VISLIRSTILPMRGKIAKRRSSRLSIIIQLSRGPISGTSYSPDGHAMVQGYPYVITEAKQDLAGFDAEPSWQGVSYYYEIVRGLNALKQTSRSTLPCLWLFYLGHSGVHILQVSLID